MGETEVEEVNPCDLCSRVEKCRSIREGFYMRLAAARRFCNSGVPKNG